MPDDKNFRLSRISTLWGKLREAHGDGPQELTDAARSELLQRYSGAVYRYLYSAVRDPHLAEDLTQEFAVRFMTGRFRQANPERGRFRDYIKTALFHLVDDHRRERRRLRAQQLDQGPDPAVEDDSIQRDADFRQSWRDELLARCWKALRADQSTKQPLFLALRMQADHPQFSSAEMAERLAQQVGTSVTPATARQWLHRARQRFAQLLVDETRHSLGEDASTTDLEQELAELDLLQYCRSALDS